ncbi:MAG: Isochorismatase [Solirubrobacterales bacterium]|nr:Isochorismatase [Solirubrobacterales bacterium]
MEGPDDAARAPCARTVVSMKRALVIVDIQRDYFPGGNMPLHEPGAAAGKAAEVLERFRASGEPVVHVQHLSPAGAGFLEEDTDGAEIMAPVTPAEGETLITKRAPNAFLGTDLEQHLRDLDVTDVVVAGMMTSMCVDATTRAGADLGFTMTLVPDACAAPGLEYGGREVPGADVHASFVAALGQFYATLTPADELR